MNPDGGEHEAPAFLREQVVAVQHVHGSNCGLGHPCDREDTGVGLKDHGVLEVVRARCISSEVSAEQPLAL